MSKPFDYSKWDKIELSDDEDDVHPNIDKESWFRMKHRSRVEREENEAKDRKKIEADVRYLRLMRLIASFRFCFRAAAAVRVFEPACSMGCSHRFALVV
jgi:Cdc37 N terminal kinase binding